MYVRRLVRREKTIIIQATNSLSIYLMTMMRTQITVRWEIYKFAYLRIRLRMIYTGKKMKAPRDKIKQINELRIYVSNLDGTELHSGAENIISPWWSRLDAAVLISSKSSNSMSQLFLSDRNRAQLELSNAKKTVSKGGGQGLRFGGQLYSHGES